MESIIYFADQTTLTLKTGDILFPMHCFMDGDIAVSLPGLSVVIDCHHNLGHTPSITSVIGNYDFFTVNSEDSILYGSKTIVRIE